MNTRQKSTRRAFDPTRNGPRASKWAGVLGQTRFAPGALAPRKLGCGGWAWPGSDLMLGGGLHYRNKFLTLNDNVMRLFIGQRQTIPLRSPWTDFDEQ